MTITKHEMTFNLSVKEVETWMVALRYMALNAKVQMIPWDSCPFFKQHLQLARLTGYCTADHERMADELAAKWATR